MNSNEIEISTNDKTRGVYHLLFPLIIGFISVIIAAIAIWHVSVTESDYRVAASEYSELYDLMPFGDKQFHPDELRVQRASAGIAKGEMQTESLHTRIDPMDVAFRLSQISRSYCDMIGWIDFDTLSISYPLMHGETNEEYLRTTFKGTKATAGSIFIESLNSADFSDMHTIIYGHNMKDGSMFGQLKNYESSDFLENNKFFTIYTPEGEEYRYEIISCKVVPLDSDIYTISFEDEDEYKCFLQAMGYEGDDAPQSVTLSTCAGSDKSYRRVVNAVRIAPVD